MSSGGATRVLEACRVAGLLPATRNAPLSRRRVVSGAVRKRQAAGRADLGRRPDSGVARRSTMRHLPAANACEKTR